MSLSRMGSSELQLLMRRKPTLKVIEILIQSAFSWLREHSLNKALLSQLLLERFEATWHRVNMVATAVNEDVRISTAAIRQVP